MKAVVFEAFNTLPKIQNVPDPKPVNHGVVVKVEATGVCEVIGMAGLVMILILSFPTCQDMNWREPLRQSVKM